MGCNSGLTNTVAMPSWFQSTHYFLKAHFFGNICQMDFWGLAVPWAVEPNGAKDSHQPLLQVGTAPESSAGQRLDPVDSVHEFADSCPLQLWVVLSVMLTLIIFNYHIYSPIILVVGLVGWSPVSSCFSKRKSQILQIVMIPSGMIQGFHKSMRQKSPSLMVSFYHWFKSSEKSCYRNDQTQPWPVWKSKHPASPVIPIEFDAFKLPNERKKLLHWVTGDSPATLDYQRLVVINTEWWLTSQLMIDSR